MATVINKSWYELLKPTWRLVKLDRRELLILFEYIVTLGLVSAAVPFVSQIVVNQTAFTGQAQPVLILALVVLAVALMGAFVKLFQLRVTELLSKRVLVRSALDGTRSILDSGASGKGGLGNREVANRFFDVMMFQSKFAILASEGLGVVVLTLLGVVILAFYHPFLLAFSLTVVIACVIVVFPLAKRGIDRAFSKSNEKYNVAYWLSQVAENRSLLRQANESRVLYGPTDDALSKYVQAHFRYLHLLLFQGGALFFLQAIAGAAFLGLGGLLVVQGRLNLGQLVAAEIILLSVLGTIGKFNYYLDSFYEMVVSGKKVTDLTGTELQPSGLKSHEPVEIKTMEISSPWLDSPISLKSGDVVVLHGTTRAKRSAFLHAISTLDADIVEVRFESDHYVPQAFIARSILYLSQPAVFRLSLADNIKILSEKPDGETDATFVYQLPLLTAREKEGAGERLVDHEVNLTDRARYSTLRAFMSDRQVVMIDLFFSLMETPDQVAYVKEFKKWFPERILILNTFEPAVEAMANKAIRLREEAS